MMVSVHEVKIEKWTRRNICTGSFWCFRIEIYCGDRLRTVKFVATKCGAKRAAKRLVKDLQREKNFPLLIEQYKVSRS